MTQGFGGFLLLRVQICPFLSANHDENQNNKLSKNKEVL